MSRITTRVYYRENMKRENAQDKKLFDELDKSKDGILQRQEIIEARRTDAKWEMAEDAALTIGGVLVGGIGFAAAVVGTGGVALGGVLAGLVGTGSSLKGALSLSFGDASKELDELERIEEENLPVSYDTGIDIEL